MMHDDERGVVTIFVVTMTTAMILVVGLVLDGGYTLAARRQAIDEADGAARAAAQAIAPSAREGVVVLDPGQAQSAVQRFLAPTGHTGQVTVQGDVVTVSVSFPHRMLILGIGHLLSVEVTGRGTARAVRGRSSAEGP
jgi:Flp pilus assembly protein TadG